VVQGEGIFGYLLWFTGKGKQAADKRHMGSRSHMSASDKKQLMF
jgi:hypothetical protein